MRTTTAMTTVILLQQNQKFERFMRQKIDELETRVSAQQARISSRETQEEQEIWADMEDLDGLLDEVAISDEAVGSDEVAISDEVARSDEAGHPAAGVDFVVDRPAEGSVEDGEPAPAAGEEIPPDYVSLMMGVDAGAQNPETDESSVDLPALPDAGDVASGEPEENEFEVLSMDRFAAIGPETGPAAEDALEREEPPPATGEETPLDYVSLAMDADAGAQRAEPGESLANLSPDAASGSPEANEVEGLSMNDFSEAGEAGAVPEDLAMEPAEGDVQQELLAQWDTSLAEEDGLN